jgi:mannitol-1-/sugar-/sorbitol-6-phosphatase
MVQEFVCRAILFDLDGVLVDSTACIERHWTRWAKRHGLDPDRVVRAAHGRPTVETMREFAPHLSAEQESARMEEGEAGDTDGVFAFPGAGELLRSLPEGAWAVATSGTRRTAGNRLVQTGLPVPRVLITADDIQQGKPHPEPYLLAAQGLGLAASDCVVVEDAPPGVASGRAAGARVVAVTTSHQAKELASADAIVGEIRDIRIVSDANGEGLRVRLPATPAAQSSREF